MPEANRAHPWLRSALTTIAIGAYGLSFVALLAHVFPSVLIFELFLSFLPHILLIGALGSTGLAFVHPRAAMAGAVFVFVAGAPFIFFSKFEAAPQEPCAENECLTIITANIYSRREAMLNLSAIADREQADLISINEAVSRMTDYSYRQAFPDYEHVVHASWENMPRHMGNPITLLARVPVIDRDRVLRNDTARRAYIVADLGAEWAETRIVVTHAMAPISGAGRKARNTILEAAGDAAAQSATFLFVGDFNLTPWTSTFRSLPGKRAGDPRLAATWPAPMPAIGLPIDHIMFAGNLELVEIRVLESIGSDHLPVLARFRKP